MFLKNNIIRSIFMKSFFLSIVVFFSFYSLIFCTQNTKISMIGDLECINGTKHIFTIKNHIDGKTYKLINDGKFKLMKSLCQRLPAEVMIAGTLLKTQNTIKINIFKII